MTATEPTIPDNARYSIGEASKLLGLHRTTLLYYTTGGLVKCGIRKTNGRKFYTGLELKKIWKKQY